MISSFLAVNGATRGIRVVVEEYLLKKQLKEEFIVLNRINCEQKECSHGFKVPDSGKKGCRDELRIVLNTFTSVYTWF